MPQTADSDESNLGEGAAPGGATAGHRAEERGDKRLWRSVVIGEQEHRIDMKCIEPYKRVISHGGTQTEMLKIVLRSGPLSLLTLRDNVFFLPVLCFQVTMLKKMPSLCLQHASCLTATAKVIIM